MRGDGGVKTLLKPTTLGPDATLNKEIHKKKSVRIKAPYSVNAQIKNIKTNWLKFYEKADIESEARTAAVQLKNIHQQCLDW